MPGQEDRRVVDHREQQIVEEAGADHDLGGRAGNEEDIEHGLRRHIGERRPKEGVVKPPGVMVVDRGDAKRRMLGLNQTSGTSAATPPRQHIAEDDAGRLLLEPIAAKPCTARS